MADHVVDPLVEEAVRTVGNRFGAAGLEDLIALATTELEAAREAARQLAEAEGAEPGAAERPRSEPTRERNRPT